MAVCVFDLDNTLGDLRLVDFFGLLLEPKVIPNHYGYGKVQRELFMNAINNYSNDAKALLTMLKTKLEEEVETDKILRPNLKEILTPLVNQFKKGTIKGFIIYSNNANLYALEYTGRAIERMFDTPNLFIKYLDRNHYERVHDIPDHSGYPSKLVKTIRQYTNEKAQILFVDDLVHHDLLNNPSVTYIKIPPYVSDAEYMDTQIVIATFEDIFDKLEEKDKTLFFNLYHIKETLKIHNFEDLERNYLVYTNKGAEKRKFIENMPMIQEKINTFIKKIVSSGGNKKRKTRRNTRRTTKRRKL